MFFTENGACLKPPLIRPSKMLPLLDLKALKVEVIALCIELFLRPSCVNLIEVLWFTECGAVGSELPFDEFAPNL